MTSPRHDTASRHLRVVMVGHVDHGKSTLIGRLLHDTDSLPEGKYEEIKAVSESRGMPIEWSFALDAFQAERDQAVTIDMTQIWFATEKRPYVIIDAPGHREFLKNMISGASAADAGVLVVDAREGVQEQTRRHAYLLHLLGLSQVAVVVNKMDLVGWDQARFAHVAEEVAAYLSRLGLSPTAIVPLSAREGENMTRPSTQMPWYSGETVIGALDGFAAAPPAVDRSLRLPLQDVYRFDGRRILVGRIETGILRVGDEIMFSPSNRTARVESIEAWNSPVSPIEARAGESVGITLDQPIFAERGDIASHADHAPMLSTVVRANLFWLSDRPLEIGKRYKAKFATREATITVQSIDRVIDTQDLLGGAEGQAVRRNEVAEVTLRSSEMLAIDPFADNPHLGRVALIEDTDLVGGGVLSMEGYPDLRTTMQRRSTNIFAVDHLLTAEHREMRNGHGGSVVWMTGLSGAGKSTIAMEVEKRLFQKGYHVYVLDGDNVRKGLNADLGFAPTDRAENIRRIGEVAALMADAGMITLTAFISPYREDRARARAAAGDKFCEIHVDADVGTCEQRDPKGLYKRARAGEIKDFTGISAPYEPPEDPDLKVDTARDGVEECVEKVLAFIETRTRLSLSSAAE